MKIEGTDPDTGETYTAEAENVDSSFVESLLNFDMSDEAIRRMIDNLNLSADAKSLLYAFSKATIKAGEYVINIGRKIIDLIGQLFKEYPSATFSVIFGAIVGFLISTIPIIGVVLGPIVTPLVLAFGLVGGLIQDVQDKNLARKIAEINASFAPLNA